MATTEPTTPAPEGAPLPTPATPPPPPIKKILEKSTDAQIADLRAALTDTKATADAALQKAGELETRLTTALSTMARRAADSLDAAAREAGFGD
jgi:hypothetical protein